MHVILFSRHAEKVREFLGEVLELRSADAGGWRIFAAPPTDMAVHPTEADPEHEVYLMCDDATTLVLPGGERIGLYEPRHPSPLQA